MQMELIELNSYVHELSFYSLHPKNLSYNNAETPTYEMEIKSHEKQKS